MTKTIIALALALVLQGYISNTSRPGYIGILASTFSPRTVVKVYHGTPAERAGLIVNDKIYRVDGDRDGEITGEPGTWVTLTVVRKDKSSLDDLLHNSFEVRIQRAPTDELPPDFLSKTE